jgi:predicted nucleic acid-binding protein
MRRHRRVAIDTNVFIYDLDANPHYSGLANAVFESILDPGQAAVTSTLTMTEILVGPYRSLDTQRADDLFAFLAPYPHLEWIAPDLAIAEAAARIRAAYGLRIVDALQVATAISSKATCLIANLQDFRKVTEIETILLDDYV